MCRRCRQQKLQDSEKKKILYTSQALKPPPGVMFHAASFDDSGKFCVAEVWESEDQWNNFLNTRLQPAFQKANASPPKTQIFQIHKIDALPGLDSYKVR